MALILPVEIWYDTKKIFDARHEKGEISTETGQLLEKLREEAAESRSSVYQIAVMDDHGIAAVRPTPCNCCNNCYSVTKTFTAAGILLLADRGLLRPEDRICGLLRRELPADYDPRWEEVTVAHCLTHTMGIGAGFLDMDVEDPAHFGPDWLAYTVTKIPLPHRPGEVYVYSDGAYYLLSRVIAAVSGEETSAFLTKYITAPLGFRESAWSKCPAGYGIGATGLYAAADDAVKLGWLFANGGRFDGRQILSETAVTMALQRGFGLSREGEIWCKRGMNGQIIIADPVRRQAVCWQSFDTDGISERLYAIVQQAAKV